MEIFTGRFSAPVLGFPGYGIINSSERGYRGEKNIINKLIEPVSADNKEYSDLYVLERENLFDVPFNWIYVINEDWLRENRTGVFNYSHSNSAEFMEFIKKMNFPVMEKNGMNGKERNHLLTKHGIPFSSVDKVIVLRNYPGYFRAVSDMRKYGGLKEELRHYKTTGSHTDRQIPKAIEFILR